MKNTFYDPAAQGRPALDPTLFLKEYPNTFIIDIITPGETA
jgi:hypothetical protein